MAKLQLRDKTQYGKLSETTQNSVTIYIKESGMDRIITVMKIYTRNSLRNAPTLIKSIFLFTI
jgi:hypothetical protein